MMLKGKKLLVTGAAGMLAADLIPALQAAGAQLQLTDYEAGKREKLEWEKLDITDEDAVQDLVGRHRPEWIINCAAYTRVDDAETKYAAAFLVNAMGPLRLAQSAKANGVRLAHISSDYVFGGNIIHGKRAKPFREDDVAAPCGLYGYSKNFGDELVRQAYNAGHLIIRTSWLHGIYGPNFIDTMLKVGKERKEIRVVNDQFGSPTWTGWLATALIGLLTIDATGTYHACSRGDVTWFDVAEEIFRQRPEYDVTVLPQTTVELNRPAPRPAYSTLDVKKIETALGKPCPDWQADVAGHLAHLEREGRL